MSRRYSLSYGCQGGIRGERLLPKRVKSSSDLGVPQPRQRKMSDSRKESLVRQNTFVISQDSEDEDVFYSSGGATSFVDKGVRRMIEGLDEDEDDESGIPKETRAYISSHFRMIREENRYLRKWLESQRHDSEQLVQLQEVVRRLRKELEDKQSQVSKMTKQLERERSKSKALLRSWKDSTSQAEQSFSSSTAVFWLGATAPDQDQDDLETNWSRPTTGTSMAPSRKSKDYKNQIAALKRDIQTYKEVLLRELGSEDAVQEALESSIEGSWMGRAERISHLEAELLNVKKWVSESDRGDGVESCSLDEGSWSVREVGDGSSEQDLLMASFNKPQDQEVMTKLHEYRAICQVSEVERDRLGQHVRVLSRKLRNAERKVDVAEEALKAERRKTAYLEILLEKLKVELAKNGNAGQTVNCLSGNRIPYFDDEVDSLKEKLQQAQKEIQSLDKRREDDLDMFLKMSADSRRIFSQALAQQTPNMSSSKSWSDPFH